VRVQIDESRCDDEPGGVDRRAGAGASLAGGSPHERDAASTHAHVRHTRIGAGAVDDQAAGDEDVVRVAFGGGLVFVR
jgi:hypothetical protein